MPAAFRHESDRLSAFLDDELGDADAVEVAQHVGRCEQCHGELEDLRATRTALRALPTVTPSLSWMVETVVLGPQDRRSHTAAVLTLASAAVVVLVAAFVLGGDQLGSVRPPVDDLVFDHVRSVGGGPVVVPVQLDADATTSDR